MDEPHASAVLRFLAKISPDSAGCWIWTGRISRNGYGNIPHRHISCSTHRFAWRLFVGPIPDGLFVCHRCDVQTCVNPEHLFLGTPAENSADMISKGRSPFGERSGRAKLTEAQVLEILDEHATGKSSYRLLAQRFGVSRSAIQFIVKGTNWSHLVRRKVA